MALVNALLDDDSSDAEGEKGRRRLCNLCARVMLRGRRDTFAGCMMHSPLAAHFWLLKYIEMFHAERERIGDKVPLYRSPEMCTPTRMPLRGRSYGWARRGTA